MNKKILEHPTFVPHVEKREATAFDEFRLSQSNTKLGKRTLEEYLLNKENASQNVFRARSLDKNLFLQKTPRTDVKQKRITEQSPFALRTEERRFLRKPSLADETSERQEGSTFKAREMPRYRFFEVKHEAQRQIVFQEFSLATQRRLSESRNRRSNSQDESETRFRALPMPDFQKMKPKTCLKRDPRVIQQEPFTLRTEVRLSEKKRQLL